MFRAGEVLHEQASSAADAADPHLFIGSEDEVGNGWDDVPETLREFFLEFGE